MGLPFERAPLLKSLHSIVEHRALCQFLRCAHVGWVSSTVDRKHSERVVGRAEWARLIKDVVPVTRVVGSVPKIYGKFDSIDGDGIAVTEVPGNRFELESGFH